jgi:hypothetical protein
MKAALRSRLFEFLYSSACLPAEVSHESFIGWYNLHMVTRQKKRKTIYSLFLYILFHHHPLKALSDINGKGKKKD